MFHRASTVRKRAMGSAHHPPDLKKHGAKSMAHGAPCSMLHAPCSMLRALCPMPHRRAFCAKAWSKEHGAWCSLLYAPCSLLYAPCPLPHAPHVLHRIHEKHSEGDYPISLLVVAQKQGRHRGLPLRGPIRSSPIHLAMTIFPTFLKLPSEDLTSITYM
jgi:hypothetical protein